LFRPRRNAPEWWMDFRGSTIQASAGSLLSLAFAREFCSFRALPAGRITRQCVASKAGLD
jgi:hypothetical protein